MQSTLYILTRKSKNRMQIVKKNFFTPKVGRILLLPPICAICEKLMVFRSIFQIFAKKARMVPPLESGNCCQIFFLYSEKDSFHKASFNCLFRVEHSVHVESVPYNKSTLVGQMPYLCHDFESCQVVSSRVETSHFRSKRSRTNKVYVLRFFFGP